MLRKAEEILKKYTLCDSCLGRLFGLKGYGLSNSERGKAIKTLLIMDHYKVNEGITDRELIIKIAETGFKPAIELARKEGFEVEIRTCYLCEGMIDKVKALVGKMIDKLNDYQYESFLVGCRLPRDIIEKEETLWSSFSLKDAESIKNEITRELGKRISEITGKSYSPTSPDVTIIVDLISDELSVYSSPIFIYGRYKKNVRGLPQNPWLHEDKSRIKFHTSIEELITEPVIRALRAKSAKFHAAGREDVDVRTLGNGRPFVVEVKSPKIRKIDLSSLENLINKEAEGLIEVKDLKLVNHSYVRAIKALAEIARKTYLAKVTFDRPISEEELAKLESLFKNITVNQRTPLRVLHRRQDRIRKKVVYEVKARKIEDKIAEFEIVCQGGLYVKELIHGDKGRTKPNFTEILGKKVIKIELDVIDIEEKI